MDQQECQLELIERARRGDRESLNELATMARERLGTYVYRMTQDDDLAQEIVQETLFEMCKALGKLKSNERFWPWLHGIATNKLRRFYRTERTQRNLAAASAKRKGEMADRLDGLENLVSEELKGIVAAAMKRLRVRHKAVLVMRCYDGMTHSEIAESLGCSEFSTRMLFLRAKRALQRELSRNGFAKGSLLTALVLFGKMTAPSKAAAAQVSVTTAAMKVGLLAEAAVLATSKTGIVSLTAAGALTAGTIVAPSILPGGNMPPLGNAVVAELGLDGNARKQNLYYFPNGLTRAMTLRATFAASGDVSERQILQHGSANYDYQDNTVNINNHRMWDASLRVPTLPTDEPETVEFLQKVAPGTISFGNVSVRDKNRYEGLLVGIPRDGAGESAQPWAVPHQNALQEDYFKADWPTTTVQVDNRDAMHRRGWTYFRISGQVNGQKVSGSGRIPFFHDAFEDGGAWLKLQVGSLTIVDTYREAHVSRAQSDPHDTYRPGSFFKGLGRPWMGLHTIDTVRRDAAEERIRFNAEYLSGGQFAQVELDSEGTKLVYNIDMKTDVVDEITFLTDQGEIGNLKFSYLQSIEGLSREFSRPAKTQKRTATRDNPGLLWLVRGPRFQIFPG